MKSVSLGELEQEVMDILWKKNTCSARDILTTLQKSRSLAYTTIATILQRLYDKKLVKRVEEKSGYIYSPLVTKESYSKTIAQSFLHKFIDSFGDTAIASFAESIDTLPEKKRQYFLTMLSEHDKNK